MPGIVQRDYFARQTKQYKTKKPTMCTHKVVENHQKLLAGYVNIILSLCFRKEEICVLFQES